jgi:hypothetical protein
MEQPAFAATREAQECEKLLAWAKEQVLGGDMGC